MKNILFLLLSFCFLPALFAQAQKQPKPGVQLFFAPTFSTIFHEDHTGIAVGFQGGVSLFRNHLSIGLLGVSRSGPLNAKTFPVAFAEGVTYRGKNSVNLRADHVFLGLMLAPGFSLGKDQQFRLEAPIAYGVLGAGFYLHGEDRNTPDGRRVSEWENELFQDADASIVSGLDVGVQGWYQLGKLEGMAIGMGLHYTQAFGWTVAVKPEDYYNRFRAAISLRFGS